jgi:hypothetical protein
MIGERPVFCFATIEKQHEGRNFSNEQKERQPALYPEAGAFRI